MRIETTAKLMLFTALMLAVCACGNTPKPQIAQRQPDKQVVAAPEPAEDPDPNMRVVAQNAPCFSSDSGRTYKATFDNIALVHRLARDNDLEALSTLETRGIFVMLSPGTIFQTKDGNASFPYQYGDVMSKRFIGKHCVIESINLIKRKDSPREVSVEEEIEAYAKHNARIDAILHKYGLSADH